MNVSKFGCDWTRTSWILEENKQISSALHTWKLYVIYVFSYVFLKITPRNFLLVC